MKGTTGQGCLSSRLNVVPDIVSAKLNKGKKEKTPSPLSYQKQPVDQSRSLHTATGAELMELGMASGEVRMQRLRFHSSSSQPIKTHKPNGARMAAPEGSTSPIGAGLGPD